MRIPSPSVFRILTRDYFAFLAVMFPLVMCGLAVATGLFGLSLPRRGGKIGPEDTSFFIYLAMGAAVIAVPLVIFRIRSYFLIFQRGVPTRGVITRVWFHKDRGRVDYEYGHLGRKYSSGQAITKNPVTTTYREGQEIGLLVDPQKPARAILPDLFV